MTGGSHIHFDNVFAKLCIDVIVLIWIKMTRSVTRMALSMEGGRPAGGRDRRRIALGRTVGSKRE
jgi:hypothetical protein